MTSEQNVINLVKSFCQSDERWHWEKEPKLTALQFWRLANFYSKQGKGDKWNFIYSAGLFSAAIVRNPVEVEEVRNDFQVMWETVLKYAEADSCCAKLADISNEIRNQVHVMRKEVHRLLGELSRVSQDADKSIRLQQEEKKVECVRFLLSFTTESYSSLMSSISKKCMNLLFGSKIPWKYAHVGLGSLARGEITVFSDFENMILLDDAESVGEDQTIEEKKLEKFRWYAVLFHIVIISLGESPLRLLGIPLFNNFDVECLDQDWFYDIFTKCGIQFDSNMPLACMHPLGRKTSSRDLASKELIKPVSKMANYLLEYFLNTQDKDIIESSSHFETTLIKTRFVAGCKDLHDCYHDKVSNMLNLHSKKLLPELTKVMRSFDSLNVLSSLSDDISKANIKVLLYRAASMLISYLGVLQNIQATNCFDIVDELVEVGKLSQEAGHNLRYAFAVANEIRMKLYQQAGQQVVDVDILPQLSNTLNQDYMSQLTDTVGTESVVDFFIIIRCLWTTLYPVIWSNVDIRESGMSGSMRDASKNAMITVYNALHLPVDDDTAAMSFSISSQSLRAPAIPEFQDFVPFSKLAAKKLILVIRYMLEMMMDYKHSSYNEDDNWGLPVLQKCSGMMEALELCNDAFERRELVAVSSKDRIRRCFFHNGYQSSHLDRYVNAVRELQQTVCHHPQDKHVVGVFPDILHLVYRVADFTEALKDFYDTVEIKINSFSTSKQMGLAQSQETTDDAFNILDVVCSLLESFKEGLKSNFLHPETNSAEDPILGMIWTIFDDGFYIFSDVNNGVKGLYDNINITRERLLPLQRLDQLERAIDDVSLVAEVLFSVLNWTFIVNAYSEVLVRDTGLALADAYRLKGKVHFAEGKFVSAKTHFQIQLRILTKNF
ncbi:unnamed protein product [Clavelina lepadiformis]|uniref:Uncharacterized protein n=1 Tax=Clavelina lepadiformis TaxID=159417 RepID=A0ABP0H3U7_CLALP